MSGLLIDVVNGLSMGFLIFMMAAGLSLIFGLMDVLNLAHGSIFAVGAYVAYEFTAIRQWGFAVAIAAAILLGVVLGVIVRQALQPVHKHGHIPQVLVTLGIIYILDNLTSIVWDQDVHAIDAPGLLQGSVSLGEYSFPIYRLFLIGIGALIALIAWIVIERTNIGSIVRATVVDEQMVASLGIRTTRVRMFVFLFGTVLATLGGVLGAPVLTASPGVSVNYLLLALVVVVIGGPGSLVGALIGSILVGQVQSTVVALVPGLAGFLLFGTMAVVLLVRPQGLFGRAEVVR